jgi:hypothetical protein
MTHERQSAEVWGFRSLAHSGLVEDLLSTGGFFSIYCCVLSLTFRSFPLLLKFIYLQLAWAKCANYPLICTQRLAICQGIDKPWYPSLVRALSLAMSSSGRWQNLQSLRHYKASISIREAYLMANLSSKA